MARALLLSLLSRQKVLLKGPAFRERYPHPWLVWESGAWNVPEVGEELGATRLPSHEVADCLPQSDVLCFELAPRADGRPLTLGRAEDCDCVVNDATVSRNHLRLGVDGAQWWVQPLEDAAEALVNRVPMERRHKTPLASGTQLMLGEVRMTFHSPESFLARVDAQAERMSRSA